MRLTAADAGRPGRRPGAVVGDDRGGGDERVGRGDGGGRRRSEGRGQRDGGGQRREPRHGPDAAASRNVAFTVRHDPAASDAGDDDFTLEPASIVITARETEGTAMLTVADDGVDEHSETLVLIATAVGGDDVWTLEFTLWDASVPMLPLVSQFLLTALLAVGGYPSPSEAQRSATGVQRFVRGHRGGHERGPPGHRGDACSRCSRTPSTRAEPSRSTSSGQPSRTQRESRTMRQAGAGSRRYSPTGSSERDSAGETPDGKIGLSRAGVLELAQA